MEWTSIAEIIIANLLSGGIIVAAVELIGGHISKKSLQKSQSSLDAKTYISKTRFDAEFRMYQELSEKNIAAVYCTGEAVVIMRSMRNTEYDEEDAPYSAEEIKQFIARFCDAMNDASKANRRYAPFISKEMYDKFFSIEKKADEIFILTKAWKDYYAGETFLFSTHGSKYQNQKEIEIAVEKKHQVLSDELKVLTNDLRDYLRNLDVIEEA